MRIAITCECPHCHKPIYGQTVVPESPVEVDVREFVSTDKIPDIVKHVAKQTGIADGDIYSKSRSMDIARARHLAWYACKEAGYSYSKIAAAFRTDHTTVMYGVKRIEREAQA